MTKVDDAVPRKRGNARDEAADHGAARAEKPAVVISLYMLKTLPIIGPLQWPLGCLFVQVGSCMIELTLD